MTAPMGEADDTLSDDEEMAPAPIRDVVESMVVGMHRSFFHWCVAMGRNMVETVSNLARHRNKLDEDHAWLGKEDDVSSQENSDKGAGLLAALQAAVTASRADGKVPVLDAQWWKAHRLVTLKAWRVERETWHVKGRTQPRGVYRDLTVAELVEVQQIEAENAVMGAYVHLCLAYSLHISVPTMPDEKIMLDGKKKVHVCVGSYASAQEPPNSFEVSKFMTQR